MYIRQDGCFKSVTKYERHYAKKSEQTGNPKTNYEVGNRLDIKGLKLQVTYDDNTTVTYPFNQKFLYSSPIKNGDQLRLSHNNIALQVCVGDESVTSSSEHGSTYINITVRPKTTIQELKVEPKPTILNYTVGQSLNTNGMVVALIDNKGTRIVLDDSQYECSPIILDKAGTRQITVKYKQNEKLKDKFFVTVKEPTYETEIVNCPKMEYKVGDKLNLKGLDFIFFFLLIIWLVFFYLTDQFLACYHYALCLFLKYPPMYFY